jgi:hypothetical protein
MCSAIDPPIGRPLTGPAPGCFLRPQNIPTRWCGFMPPEPCAGAASLPFTPIVVKEQNSARYTRYDYTAWGDPIRVNGFAPDGRWFGGTPETVAAADGEAAAAMIPRIQSAIASYKPRSDGDYRAWPGPNSNTFVAAVISAVPELRIALPPTAIGKDFPYSGEYFGLTPSGTGIRATLGGYFGLTVGWVEGVEINLLGAVLGIDVRRPAIKLPGIGRLGVGV